MADISPTYLRALGIPMVYGLDADRTSVEEAGPVPGSPSTSDNTFAVVETLGTQDDTIYNLLFRRGGLPGEAGRASVLWKKSTDAASGYRGYNPPSSVWSFESVDSGHSGTGDIDAISFGDGSSLVVGLELTGGYYYPTTYLVSSAGAVTRTRFTAYPRQSIVSATTGEAVAVALCMVPHPETGDITRVLLFNSYWVRGNYVLVAMFYSDDYGATWTLGTKNCLRERYDYSALAPGATGIAGIYRLRATYKDGEILLVASALLATTSGVDYTDVLVQWASSDYGSTFDFVSQWGGIESAADDTNAKWFDVVVVDGFFKLYHLQVSDTGGTYYAEPVMRKVATAYDPFDNVLPFSIIPSALAPASETYGIVTTNAGGDYYISEGALTAWISDDGLVYMIVGRLKATGTTGTQINGVTFVSYDGGESFVTMGEDPISTIQGYLWWSNGISDVYFQNIKAIQYGAGALMFGRNFITSGANEDNLRALYLGGYSTVTLPGLVSDGDDQNRVVWQAYYWPLTDPAQQGYWAATGGGAGATGVDYWQITTTGANVLYYEDNPTDIIQIIFFSMTTVSGGSIASDDIAMRIITDNTAVDYDVSIRFNGTQIGVYDRNAGAGLGPFTVDSLSGVDVLVAVGLGKISMWTRPRGSYPDDREWTQLLDAASITDGGGGAGTNTIRWGNIAAAAAVSRWHQVCYVDGDLAGADDEVLHDGQTNPTDLYGRRTSADRAFLHDELFIRQADGPAMAGDAFTIAPEYTYPIEATDPSLSPSPKATWRSTTGAAQRISWTIDPSAADTLLDGTSIALLIEGANWRTATLYGRTAAGVRTSLGSIDLATGMTGLQYDLSGSVATPRAGTNDTTSWLAMNELVGGSMDLAGSIRRITRNTAGLWTDAVGAVPMRIAVELQGGEAASGACNIWAPGGVVIIHAVGAAYTQLELDIAAQTTADTYIEAGIITPMLLIPFGVQYGRGRSITLEPSNELTTLSSGARFSRATAPPRRAVRFAWGRPVDESPLYASAPSPNIVSGVAGSPLVAPADTAYTVEGILRRLEGSSSPCVYIPQVPRGAGALHLLRQRQRLYGRLVSGVDTEATLGDEGTTEMRRIQSLSIEEEL